MVKADILQWCIIFHQDLGDDDVAVLIAVN